MKKNIAVVGCGYWGKNLVRNFYELGVLAAICDPNQGLAQLYSTKYSVPNLSFEEVITNPLIEGVALAVPAASHADMAIAVMNSGKHVCVEKPLAMNNAEADKMLGCAAENGVQLMVGHLLQYHPAFIELKRLVSTDEIGEVHYMYSNRMSFGKVRSEEDVIWSFAPHDISMILALSGAEPSRVIAESSACLQDGIADIATLHLEFPCGLRAHVNVSWLNPYKEQKLVVIGSRGMLVFDDTQPWAQKLAIHRHVTDEFPESGNIARGDQAFIGFDELEPLRQECSHFIDVVSGLTSPRTDGKEGARVLSVLTAASTANLGVH